VEAVIVQNNLTCFLIFVQTSFPRLLKSLALKLLLVIALGTVLIPYALQSPAFASRASRYVVTFSATGINFLGAGPDTIYPIYFTVNFNGVTYSALANESIKISVPEGTYSWSAPSIQNAQPCTECPTFWQAGPGSGSISLGQGASVKQVTHLTIKYLDKVSVSIIVPLSNKSSDGYPVTSVSTEPEFQNVVIKPGQYWQASGYMTYGTAIQIRLDTNPHYTDYAFSQWGAIMVCTSTNRFSENTILYASNNCQFQALFNPSP
jgi:hypothetical protein